MTDLVFSMARARRTRQPPRCLESRLQAIYSLVKRMSEQQRLFQAPANLRRSLGNVLVSLRKGTGFPHIGRRSRWPLRKFWQFSELVPCFSSLGSLVFEILRPAIQNK